ncbi:hypothetical protein [Skermanella stibiiresistens]|uniref:hypothetical protein n=1 Tax=Skermanella stibiiresistens TaxID=913326 RepID=UPI0018DE1B02|nr:hypothetical protein [Skermanella stibiiresistens]
MLKRAARQIGRDADVQRAIWSIGHDVDPASGHGAYLAERGGKRDATNPGISSQEIWRMKLGSQVELTIVASADEFPDQAP